MACVLTVHTPFSEEKDTITPYYPRDTFTAIQDVTPTLRHTYPTKFHCSAWGSNPSTHFQPSYITHASRTSQKVCMHVPMYQSLSEPARPNGVWYMYLSPSEPARSNGMWYLYLSPSEPAWNMQTFRPNFLGLHEVRTRLLRKWHRPKLHCSQPLDYVSDISLPFPPISQVTMATLPAVRGILILASLPQCNLRRTYCLPNGTGTPLDSLQFPPQTSHNIFTVQGTIIAYRVLSPAHLLLPYLMLPAARGTFLHGRQVAIDYVTLCVIMGPAPLGRCIVEGE